LTKVPIDGQPPSIVQELEDMARQYIKGENAIVLVSAQQEGVLRLTRPSSVSWKSMRLYFLFNLFI